MKVWMRLGIEFDATEEEMLAVDGYSDKMMELLKSKQIEIVGNSYIPENMGLYDEDGKDYQGEVYDKIYEQGDFEFSGNNVEIK